MAEGSTTKYARVKGELLRRIESGEFTPDGCIPSENEISRAYGVSVMTARRALSDLVHVLFPISQAGKSSRIPPSTK